MPAVFFLTPLSMVGGVFNTVTMLPPWLRWLAYGNPFFYFINGIRGAMIGFDEAPQGLSIGLTLLLLVVLGVLVWRLYARVTGFGNSGPPANVAGGGSLGYSCRKSAPALENARFQPH